MARDPFALSHQGKQFDSVDRAAQCAIREKLNEVF
jgi:hypothetical protein